MSVDFLQERIRKLKNPSAIDFGIKMNCLPPHLLEQENTLCGAYGRFCRELMEALKDFVPAVRFGLGNFALLGPEGLLLLQTLLNKGKELGFYVILDGPELLSPWAADTAAEIIFGQEGYSCNGLIISPYIGSDSLKPFVPYCKENNKDVFVAVRSANKTASEIQDLLTGSRHVHSAAAEIVARFTDDTVGTCGYSRVCAMVGAGSPEVLRKLRATYNRMFLLVDGLDYPGGNAKNCALAFDRFGHGAAVCAGPSVTAAWADAQASSEDYVQEAVRSVERMKKNIMRYITVI